MSLSTAFVSGKMEGSRLINTLPYPTLPALQVRNSGCFFLSFFFFPSFTAYAQVHIPFAMQLARYYALFVPVRFASSILASLFCLSASMPNTACLLST